MLNRWPGSRRVIYLLATTIVVSLLIANALIIGELRARALAQAGSNLQHLNAVLTAEATRSFEAINLALVHSESLIFTDGLSRDEATLLRRTRSTREHELLMTIIRPLPQLEAMFIIGADGRFLATSEPHPPRIQDFSFRKYYRVLRKDAALPIYISAPTKSITTGMTTVFFARRITGPHHAFLGVMIADLSLPYYQSLYKSALPAGTAVAIDRIDNVQLARYPEIPRKGQLVAKTIRSGSSEDVRYLSRVGLLTHRSPADGQLRIVAASRARGFPIVLMVSMPQSLALQDWHTVVASIAWVMAGCIVAVIFCVVLLMRARASERARAEAELSLSEQRERTARAASEAKTTFLADMSHEIRTPMNAIVGMAELLDQTALDEQQKRLVTVMQRSCSALLSVVNDIVDLAKVESGRLAIRAGRFNPVVLAQGVIEALNPLVAGKPVVLRSEIAAAADEVVLGDEGKIRQILLNLASNAVKFTAAGSVTIAVESLREGEEWRRLRFTIRDTGIGIPKSMQATLTERFSPANDNVAGKYGGSGLGLCISKQLVAFLDGRMGFSSVEGGGSTFWFEVPVLPATAERAEPEPTAPSLTRPLHVLVVEDNAINVEVAEQMLHRRGHTTEVVRDGAAAVTRVTEGRFDLVLMDVQMPVMNGIEATASIRRHPGAGSRTPIVAMTAGVMSIERERCFAAGMDDYLSKPITGLALEAVLETIGGRLPV